jgi:hypothetical protein
MKTEISTTVVLLIKRNRIFHNHFYKASIALILEPNNSITREITALKQVRIHKGQKQKWSSLWQMKAEEEG